MPSHASRGHHAAPRARFRAAVALGVLLLSGCVGGGGVPVEPLQADVVISLERAKNVPAGALFLKAIPGGLLGKTADTELFRAAPGREVIRISARSLAAVVDGYARQLRDDRVNPGELVQPADLRLARIGAFYETVHEHAGCDSFRTGLSLGTPAGAMLVYVDRAGRVRGQRYSRPYVMDYQLEFPGAGIYAIALRAQGMVVTQRVVAVPSHIDATVRRAPCT